MTQCQLAEWSVTVQTPSPRPSPLKGEGAEESASCPTEAIPGSNGEVNACGGGISNVPDRNGRGSISYAANENPSPPPGVLTVLNLNQ